MYFSMCTHAKTSSLYPQCPPRPASDSLLHVCLLSSSTDEINTATHSLKPWNVAVSALKNSEWSTFREREKKKIKALSAQVPRNALHSSRLPQSPLRFKQLVQWHFLIVSHTAGKGKNKEAVRVQVVCSRQQGGVRRCPCRVDSNQVGVAVKAHRALLLCCGGCGQNSLCRSEVNVVVAPFIHFRNRSTRNSSLSWNHAARWEEIYH